LALVFFPAFFHHDFQHVLLDLGEAALHQVHPPDLEFGQVL
jgi:hypothetical protein